MEERGERERQTDREKRDGEREQKEEERGERERDRRRKREMERERGEIERREERERERETERQTEKERQRESVCESERDLLMYGGLEGNQVDRLYTVSLPVPDSATKQQEESPYKQDACTTLGHRNSKKIVNLGRAKVRGYRKH